jgi:uncharacterized protein (DUF697 family)
MTEKSLKTQAEEIMVAVDRDLQQAAKSKTPATLKEVDSKANVIAKTIFNAISDVDIEAATERVKKLKEKYPQASPQELSQRLIHEKCQRTGAVGAVTSGAGLVPGLGPAAAVTLGVAADIGATFKLQAELVLEIAAVYDYPLTEQEKQRLVMAITGLSAGTSALARRAGRTMSIKIGERLAEKTIQKTVMKALPIVGVVASAGTNVLSSYIIGQRADAYFRLGPETVGSWSDSLRTITGVDERQAVAVGASKVAETVGPALSSGAQKAGETAQKGFKFYIWWVVTCWTTLFRVIGEVLRFIWVVVSFIPRKVMGLFRGKHH